MSHTKRILGIAADMVNTLKGSIGAYGEGNWVLHSLDHKWIETCAYDIYQRAEHSRTSSIPANSQSTADYIEDIGDRINAWRSSVLDQATRSEVYGAEEGVEIVLRKPFVVRSIMATYEELFNRRCDDAMELFHVARSGWKDTKMSDPLMRIIHKDHADELMHDGWWSGRILWLENGHPNTPKFDASPLDVMVHGDHPVATEDQGQDQSYTDPASGQVCGDEI